MNVEIIGDVCIDRNVSEHAEYTSAGGPTTFMSRIFRKFPDVTTAVIANYGPDFVPYLKNMPIYPPLPNSQSTLIFENDTKSGRRTQKVHNTDANSPVPLDEQFTTLLQNADAVVFAPLLPHYSPAYIKTILSNTKEEVIKVLLPQGYFREMTADGTIKSRSFAEEEAIVPLFDFIILSEEDYPDVGKLAAKWLELADVSIIVTKGEKGASVMSRSTTYSVETTPIPRSEITDSVGAGDIFSASFIYAFMITKDIRKSVKFANSIAGQSLAFTPLQLETAPFDLAI